jgi:hypothetical protein
MFVPAAKHMCWRPPQDEADKILGTDHPDSYPAKSALAYLPEALLPPADGNGGKLVALSLG